MTFSIVAFDQASRSWGVAVASKFLAVGSLVPWGRAGVGAVATQAQANLSYGPKGLALLEAGMQASAVVARLTQSDERSAHRQIGVVDGAGSAATFTGKDCLDWAGGSAGEGFAVQGNILSGPTVIEAMADAFSDGSAFENRLLAALAAGDLAGGDRRGRQSAALRVWRAGAAYGGELDIAIDLRSDDHPDPVSELSRLLELHRLYFGEADPADLLPLEGSLAHEVGACLSRIGHASAGGVERALERWAGIENLEERMVPGKIDPAVLDVLRARAAEAGPAPGVG